MRELALHILDILQNSIAASASLITIKIKEDRAADQLIIEVKDNGKGISPDNLRRIADPFFTSRTTREVGLGLSLLADSTRRADGKLIIESKPGKGTKVVALFRHSHIDRAPMGDLKGTLITALVLNPEIDFVYHHICGNKHFLLDTRVIKAELNGININHRKVVGWLEDYISEKLEKLQGGKG